MQRSFLKWCGGKSTALTELFKHLPQEGECLIEPFMGSSTVALNTEYDRYVLNDYNSDLVYLCAWIAKKPKEVVELAKVLYTPENNQEERYYELRREYNFSVDPKKRAILFLYLNRHGYNGLCRYNKSGGYNVPFGSYKRPYFPEQEIYQYAEKFKHARFVCGGYQSLRFKASKSSNVYCDPPYLPLSKSASFASYTKLGFARADHLSLNKKSHGWAQKVGGVWLSNHAVPLIDECYSLHKERDEFMVPRTVSRAAKNRKPVKEVILRY